MFESSLVFTIRIHALESMGKNTETIELAPGSIETYSCLVFITVLQKSNSLKAQMGVQRLELLFVQYQP